MTDTLHSTGLARQLFPEAEFRLGMFAVLAFYVVLILCPNATVLPWLQSSFDEKRLFQVTVLVVSGIAMLGCSRTAQGCRDAWLELPWQARCGVISLFLLGTLSSLMAAAPRYALLETSQHALLFCTTLLIASLCRDTKGRLAGSLLAALILSVALYLLAFATVYLAARVSGGSLAPALLLPGFSNMRFLGQFQTWTLPLLGLALITWGSAGRTQRLTFRLLLGGWWFIAFVSEGRGTMVAVTVALAFCGIAFKAAARPMLKEQLLGILLGLVLYGGLFVLPSITSGDQGPSVHTAAQAGGLNHREDLWAQAAAMTAENPWLGVGPLHYAYYRNPLGAHPHNALLQWSAEWGIPATVVAVSLLAWGLHAWLRLCGRLVRSPAGEYRQQTAIALTASALAGAVHAMVSGIIVMPLSQLMLVVVTGLMLGLYRTNTSVNGATLRQGLWSTRLLGGILAATTAALMVPDLMASMSGPAENLQSTLEATGPRFWMFGDFPR